MYTRFYAIGAYWCCPVVYLNRKSDVVVHGAVVVARLLLSARALGIDLDRPAAHAQCPRWMKRAGRGRGPLRSDIYISCGKYWVCILDIAPPKYRQIQVVLRAKYRNYMHTLGAQSTRRLVMHYIVNRVSSLYFPLYFPILTQYFPEP